MEMKTYETFRDEMRRLLAEKAERAGYVLLEDKFYDVNQELDGIRIEKTPSQDWLVCVFLQDAYHDYVQEMGEDEGNEAYAMQSVTEEAWALLTAKSEFELEMEKISTDMSGYADRIIWQVVNTKRNQKLLETVPHRQFLDLAVIYHIWSEDDAGCIINNRQAEEMGLDEEALFQAARRNRKELLPVRKITPPGSHVTFLTNQKEMFGAGLILESQEIKQVADRIKDDLYIWASSIHELILAPVKEWTADILKKRIWDANRTVTKPEFYLSDTLYYYDREKDEVRIA